MSIYLWSPYGQGRYRVQKYLSSSVPGGEKRISLQDQSICWNALGGLLKTATDFKQEKTVGAFENLV